MNHNVLYIKHDFWGIMFLSKHDFNIRTEIIYYLNVCFDDYLEN